mmetsp:Transcript_32418/g.75590  ORF Transcript_32418/g.75590 Transcript_32418/m.75590 type:complete len:249 (+) Transcript_32418:612-1358(+)
MQRPRRVPVLRVGQVLPVVPPVDDQQHRVLGHALQLVEEVEHRPQRRRELVERIVPVMSHRRQHVRQRWFHRMAVLALRIVRSQALVLDLDLTELRLLREIDRDEEVGRRLWILIHAAPTSIGLDVSRYLLKVGAVGDAVRLVRRLCTLRAEPERPVRRARNVHHKPVGLLRSSYDVVECVALPAASWPIHDEARPARQEPFLLHPKELVSQFEPRPTNHQRRRFDCTLLHLSTAEASVEEYVGESSG